VTKTSTQTISDALLILSLGAENAIGKDAADRLMKLERDNAALRAKVADQGMSLACLADGILGEDAADRSDQTLVRIGCQLKRQSLELEEHIDRCERLLRCWCKPGTFSNSEELRMETLEMLDGRPEKARPALEDLTSENARLKQAISQLQKLAAVADREIAELKTQLANK